MKTKLIFTIGGIFSGIGKGTTSASFAYLFKNSGLKVSCLKHDPYLNYDAKNINPNEHGDPFITETGDITDIDLSSYERFLDQNTHFYSSSTLGKIFTNVIQEERTSNFEGESGGKTVDLSAIPHAIIDSINKAIAHDQPDILIVEIGGNVTDDNVNFYLKAISILQKKFSKEQIVVVFLTYLSFFEKSQEYKTRAASYSIDLLRKKMVEPDLVIFRIFKNDFPKNKEIIAKKCNLNFDQVYFLPETPNIYNIPQIFYEKKTFNFLIKKLNLQNRIDLIKLSKNLKKWKIMTKKIDILLVSEPKIKIAVISKYPKFETNHSAIFEALRAASIATEKSFTVELYNDHDILVNPKILNNFKNYDGVLLPGGFSKSDFEGYVLAAGMARDNKIPFLGICFGLQASIISFARDKLGIKDANSSEFFVNSNKKFTPIIDYHNQQTKFSYLGSLPITILPQTKFGTTNVKITKNFVQNYNFSGRHFNMLGLSPKYLSLFKKSNYEPMAFLKNDPEVSVFFQLKNHPFYWGVSNHHEFSARPDNAPLIYLEFFKACLVRSNQK